MSTYFDLIIRNADVMVFNPYKGFSEKVRADLGIKNGLIASLNPSPWAITNSTFNARGLTILPGVIDSQVHFREPGLTHKEDLESGTRAALLGGVTTIFEMPNTKPSTTTPELFADKLARAQGRAHCHYAFFGGAAKDNLELLGKLEDMPHCSGIKVFMGSSTGTLLVEDDGDLENILRHTRRRVIFHSEDEMRLRERKHIADQGSVHQHPEWRDHLTALKSTQRLLKLARQTGRQVHVLHVSTAEEMDLLKDNKDIATVEVLPQHLTLFAPDCYDRLGTLAQQNPPIRDKRHYDRIWQAVNDRTVDVLGSDHAPHTLEEKAKSYPQSPSGVPGVQTLVPLMLDHVNKGRLSLERFVELVSEGPRRVFGLRNKGRIEVGLDADLTIVDLNAQRTIHNHWIASRCGWTPYDGMSVTGWPTHVFLKGQLCMESDQIVRGHQGQGAEF